jgi:pSer/pThr/pTyr-binding forkhead associated (FHA) protein
MKSFLNACGIKDSLRLSVEGPEVKESESRWFPQPFVVLGRDHRADMLLNDPRISRRHVYLQAVGGWLFWVDLESRTGTRTEIGPRKSGWLTGNGFLGVGPYAIRRRAAATEPAGEAALDEPPWDLPLVAQAYSREPVPEVALEFLNGPSRATVWPMRRVLSMIGSARSCKFRLTDRSVSAFHASLVRTPAGLWVVDLRGGHSISVNGVPMRSSALVDGDVLSIGRYQIRIRCQYRGQEVAVGASDLAREEPAGRLAWQISRGPDPRGLPLPDRAAGAMASLGASSGTHGPVSSSVPSLISQIETVGSGVALPGSMSQPEVCESVLAPLVNQFSMMQQQMFDQFQQAMGMLVQMFGTMHREQMEVIREELDRLHQLSKELQELKEELAKPSRQPLTTVGVLAAEVSPVVPPPTPTTVAAPEPRATTATGFRTPITPGTGRTPPLSTPPVPPRPDQSRPEPASAGMPGAQASAPPDRDAVAWIHQRIMTIQSERETRWQKILKLLPGVS